MKKFLTQIKRDIYLVLRGLNIAKQLYGLDFFVCMFIDSLLSTITPYFTIYMSGTIITLLTQNKDFKTLITKVIIALGVVLISDIIIRLARKKCLIIYSMVGHKYESALTQKALSLDYAQSESSYVSKLRAKVTETSQNQGLGIIWLGNHVISIISSFISIIIALVILAGMFIHTEINHVSKNSFFINVVSSPIFLISLIAIFILLIIIANHKKARAVLKAQNEASLTLPIINYYSEKVLNENAFGKDIRIFNERKLILDELKESVSKPLENSVKKILKINQTLGIVPAFVSTFIGIIIYIFVGIKALIGVFGAGKIIEYYGAINKLIDSIINLVSGIGLIKSNNLYIEQELEYFDLKTNMDVSNKKIECGERENLEFEFSNISFKYPNTKEYVLKNFSAKIHHGEKIAIVGVNGSGKTTLIKLLCRLYDPTEGEIKLNGINIKEYDYNEYLDIFSVVFQDFKLLAFPIGETIACSEQYDEEQVWKCLDMVGLKDRVDKMPKGLKQSIYSLYEEDGYDLSGGEEQKIAIARALYKNAPFIILDEPTAALDPISEHEVYSQFNTLVREKTAVYISHRLSSCKFCDKIFVLDHGQIIQIGSHENLLENKNGKYYELWNAQAQYYK